MTKPTPAKSPFSITLLRAKIRTHNEKIRMTKQNACAAHRAYQALPEEEQYGTNSDAALAYGLLRTMRSRAHTMHRLVLWYKNDRLKGVPLRVDTHYAKEIVKACAPNVVAELAALADKVK
jgi:hypothetical protein